MLIRCCHCGHRILVRNAKPRTYQLACPKCHRDLFLLIEGASGPDQRLALFQTFEQMKQQILQAKASRPISKLRTTDPIHRPESPEVIHGTSAGITSDDDELDYVIPQRPDSPMSISSDPDQQSMVQDAGKQEEDQQSPMEHHLARILPHAAPVAFSVDDEDQEHDVLQEALAQVNEEHMAAPEESDQKIEDKSEFVKRPDSPRVMEEELTVQRQRPEFNVVDEVIPTFPTDKQQQEMHPDPHDTDDMLVMSADDLQTAEPSMLLELSNNEEDTAATDASMDEDPPVDLPSNDTPEESPESKGWRRWFGKS